MSQVKARTGARLAWLGLIAVLAVTACGSAAQPMAASQPSATSEAVKALPTATAIPATASPAPTAAPSSTQSPSPQPTYTAAPTITAQPTGVFEDAGYQAGNGQNPYTALVRYQDFTGSWLTLTIHFLLYLPASYGNDSTRKWPLIMYLHGSGESGRDLGLVRGTSLPMILDSQPDFPFIVLSPQCPDTSSMWSSQIDGLNALLDLMISRYQVDPQRLYLTGFSMGGFGTWAFALSYPQRFAAIAPVAGGYVWQSDVLPPNLCDLKNLPVWVFHGDQDGSVAPEQEIILVKGLKACGGNVRFTLYQGAGHQATAAQAYADPELYAWLASQKAPVQDE